LTTGVKKTNYPNLGDSERKPLHEIVHHWRKTMGPQKGGGKRYKCEFAKGEKWKSGGTVFSKGGGRKGRDEGLNVTIYQQKNYKRGAWGPIINEGGLGGKVGLLLKKGRGGGRSISWKLN